jgi:ParB family chromosome partitioning protein
MIRTIALDKLIPWPRNVWRSTDAPADEQLKADIAARGLLQNLVVAPAKKPKGCFTVEAGGRRLRALKLLAEEGALSATHVRSRASSSTAARPGRRRASPRTSRGWR